MQRVLLALSRRPTALTYRGLQSLDFSSVCGLWQIPNTTLPTIMMCDQDGDKIYLTA